MVLEKLGRGERASLGEHMKPLRFDQSDYKKARREWGCNCVPVAFAAIAGLTLSEARRFFPEFNGHATEAMLKAALDIAGLDWRDIGMECPRPGRYGLVRLWHGGEKYHRIATWNSGSGIYAADCGSLAWLSLGKWEEKILPLLKAREVRIDGVIEVE